MITHILLFLILGTSIASDMQTIYTFTPQTNIREWRMVNDGVMGGISRSSMMLTEAGHGRFSGRVSLANNGGFASMQLTKSIALADAQTHIVLRVKGDGKRYEFRLNSQRRQAESYVHGFATSGDWETIRLPLRDFYPQFRGRRLNRPNFDFATIEQMSFFIANGKEEAFELMINWIGLE